MLGKPRSAHPADECGGGAGAVERGRVRGGEPRAAGAQEHGKRARLPLPARREGRRRPPSADQVRPHRGGALPVADYHHLHRRLDPPLLLQLLRVMLVRRRWGEEHVAGVPDLDGGAEEARGARGGGLRRERRIGGAAGEHLGLLLQHLGRGRRGSWRRRGRGRGRGRRGGGGRGLVFVVIVEVGRGGDGGVGGMGGAHGGGGGRRDLTSTWGER